MKKAASAEAAWRRMDGSQDAKKEILGVDRGIVTIGNAQGTDSQPRGQGVLPLS